MTGQIYLEKKIGPHACLRVNNNNILFNGELTYYSLDVRAIMSEQIMHSKDT